MSNGADLPDDVDTLRAMLAQARASIDEQGREIERLLQDMAERELEIERLKAQIDKLKRMHFGRKSEQPDRQIALLESGLEDLTAGLCAADVRRARASTVSTSGGGTSPKEALPHSSSARRSRVRTRSELPAVRKTPCGLMGDDISEQFARVAAAFRVIRTIRPRAVCGGCNHFSQPPMSGLGRLWVYVRDDNRSGSTEPAAVWFANSSDRKGIHPGPISPDSRSSCRRTPTEASTSCT
nr:hypothetical protein [Burkholderia sp. Bp8986]